MKFMDYSYTVKTSLQTTFDYLIDLEQVHHDTAIFKNAEVSSNNLPPNQPGKTYYVALRSGRALFQTNIELTKISPPNTAVFQYTYYITDDQGTVVSVEEWPLIPWTSLTLIVGMEQEKKNTRVTSVIVANGIKTNLGKIGATILSLFGRLQQSSANRKVKKRLNGMLG